MMKIFVNRVSCKWVKHYMNLVNRAKDRSIEGYVERHHVVPRCMGGGDSPDNLISLTPEEHYTAHLLLMKIFPENAALARAAVMMCADSPTTPRQNKVYGWVRRRYAEHCSERMRAWHKGNTHPFQGGKHTEDAKRRIGEKASARQKKDVFCFSRETGELVAVFKGVRAAAEFAGVNDQTIYSCIRIPGKRTAGGYSWSYKNESPGILALTEGGRVKWAMNKKCT